MGQAIIKGLARQKKFLVYVWDIKRLRLNTVSRHYHLKKLPLAQLAKAAHVIILCVKPQDIDEVLSKLSRDISSRQLIISIAAGVTTKHIQKFFKSKISVVRTMPNMPAVIAEGVTAYCLGKYASRNSAEITRLIFSTIGKTLKITESKMNAVTAISGSGPGFVAYLTDALKEAAVSIGLNKQQAEFFSVYVVSGTGRLLEREKIKPAELVKRVASKGGTTEAGIRVFRNNKVKSIITKAIKAAANRAKELSAI